MHEYTHTHVVNSTLPCTMHECTHIHEKPLNCTPMASLAYKWPLWFISDKNISLCLDAQPCRGDRNKGELPARFHGASSPDPTHLLTTTASGGWGLGMIQLCSQVFPILQFLQTTSDHKGGEEGRDWEHGVTRKIGRAWDEAKKCTQTHTHTHMYTHTHTTPLTHTHTTHSVA